MKLIESKMFVLREKGTNCYKRNNGFTENLDSKCKSAIKLYETENLANSAIRNCFNFFDVIPVKVTIEMEETES